MSYCSCSHSRMGSSSFKNGTTKRPRHRAHHAGSRNRAATRMERHCRLQPHVQKLLGSVEITHCEKRHTTAQLGFRQWTISNRPNSSPSEQSKGCAERSTWWIVRRSLGCQQNPELCSAMVLLAPGRGDIERWCRLCDIRAASRGPWTRNWGQIHQYNVAVPFERVAIDVAGPFPRSDQGNDTS
jgi:hypothetical protein